MERSYPALVILLFLFSPLCKVRFKTKMMLRAPHHGRPSKRQREKFVHAPFPPSASSPREKFSLSFSQKCRQIARGGGGRKEEKGGRWALRTYVCAISPPLNFFFFSVTLWRRRMGRCMLFQGTLVGSSEKFYVPFRYDNCTLLFKSFPENLSNTFLFR